MKTMSCKQLGGACDMEFHGNTFEEIAALSQQHGMDMFQQQDPVHMQAMNEIRQMMQQPGAMQKWFEAKKQEFANLPVTD